MDKIYVSPTIEVIEVEVEEGFASSPYVEVMSKSLPNNFNTSNFGGGRTMNDF